VPTIFFNQIENPSKNLGPNLGPTERPNSKLTSGKRLNRDAFDRTRRVRGRAIE
jgi:hypothetical protein